MALTHGLRAQTSTLHGNPLWLQTSTFPLTPKKRPIALLNNVLYNTQHSTTHTASAVSGSGLVHALC